MWIVKLKDGSEVFEIDVSDNDPNHSAIYPFIKDDTISSLVISDGVNICKFTKTENNQLFYMKLKAGVGPQTAQLCEIIGEVIDKEGNCRYKMISNKGVSEGTSNIHSFLSYGKLNFEYLGLDC